MASVFFLWGGPSSLGESLSEVREGVNQKKEF